MSEAMESPTVLYVFEGENTRADQDERDVRIDLFYYLRSCMTPEILSQEIHLAFLHELIHWWDAKDNLGFSERNVDLILQALGGDEDMRGKRNIVDDDYLRNRAVKL